MRPSLIEYRFSNGSDTRPPPLGGVALIDGLNHGVNRPTTASSAPSGTSQPIWPALTSTCSVGVPEPGTYGLGGTAAPG